VNDRGGFDDVTVRGGRVEAFIEGARFDHARGVVVRDFSSRGIYDDGVRFESSSDSVVKDSALASSWRGVLAQDSRRIDTHNNNMNNIGHAGVALKATGDSTIHDSTFTTMGDYGSELINASGTLVTHNRIRRANSDGIVIATIPEQYHGLPSLGNKIVENDVRSGSTGIELVEVDNGIVRDTLVSGNTVLDTSDNGIIVDGVTTDGSGNPPYTYLFGPGPDKTRIVENTTNGNAVDGIHLDSPGNFVARNVANRNAAFGIGAFPGNTDGGDNRARGNGEPAQCSGVHCS
jgi:hypothetical protein